VERRHFKERLDALPARPGVYLFKDSTGTVLYVGKAASLRARVRSYFGAPSGLPPKTRTMVALADDLDFFVTDSEQEAIILENNLIKKHMPPYNVRLRDDKSYPYIKITLNEEYPRVFLTRRFEDDGGRYFGPYASAGSVHRTLDLLKELFRYCAPKEVIKGNRPRPCFDYYLNRCVGACSGEISQEEYREITQQVILFLEGKQAAVVRTLRGKMKRAASAQLYERAANLRDRLEALEKVSQAQKIMSPGRRNQDVIAFAGEQNEAVVQVFAIRGGNLTGKEQFFLEGTQDEERQQIMASFIELFYGSAPYIPPVLLLQVEPYDAAVLQAWLEGRRGGRIRLTVPQRGESRRLLDMVAENAYQALEQRKAKWLADSGKTAAALQELAEQLNLPKLPKRMECYDISDIGGDSAVGSMVVFENGRPKSSQYRRFRIRTVAGIDDYAMMREVLRRRFKRAKAEDDSSWAALPDLVIIDGGKGHLAAALGVMQDLGVDSIPLASLAKENEEVFLPGAAEALALPRDSQALYLLQRIRDEAHRFAISYHHKVHRKKALSSQLEVPGIGPKRRRALLKHFGSLRQMREAPVEEIASVPGMSRALAERLKDSL
jgi:excinuclease ABC subunit C